MIPSVGDIRLAPVLRVAEALGGGDGHARGRRGGVNVQIDRLQSRVDGEDGRRPAVFGRASRDVHPCRGLADPHFAKTVVLLVHYDAEGVVGLILNRRTDVPLSRVLEGIKATKDLSDRVYLGGPVETPAVFALLQSPAKLEGAQHIFGPVYLISTKTLFEQTISARPDPSGFHVYLGCAGWTKDQLPKEMEMGGWFIFQGDAGTVFDSDPDSLWSQMIQKTELKSAGSGSVDADRSRAALDNYFASIHSVRGPDNPVNEHFWRYFVN